MTRLRISEHFYSIQGEGPSVGVPAIFVRLQGCNLLCGDGSATWTCDTIPVWKKGTPYHISDWHALFLDEYHNALAAGAHVVITGGEPLLQALAIKQWLALFETDRPFIEIETNGTVMPTTTLLSTVSQWNVSPKLSNSGEPLNKRYHPTVLQTFQDQPNSIFKFVVQSPDDVTEISTFAPTILTLPIHRKFLMPAADTKTNLISLYPPIIELAKTHGFSVGQRFHIDIWDQKTGI
ncbi:MAG: 7-carboxy-7-deazaguanine synthase QueE [Candidatus Marinamargulisbacteria bacterium]